MEAPFAGEIFTHTQFHTAADKADFANHLVRFLTHGCPFSLFTKRFYNRLNKSFGHIAHYDRFGFYLEWFSTHQRRLAFLERLLSWATYGDPAYTFSDVERAVQKHLQQTSLLQQFEIAARTLTEEFSPFATPSKDAPLAHVTVEQPELFSNAA